MGNLLFSGEKVLGSLTRDLGFVEPITTRFLIAVYVTFSRERRAQVYVTDWPVASQC
jgi:hypothetical protein